MRKSVLIFSVIAILSSFPAFADEKPVEISSTITATNPYGKAQLRQLFFHVYDVALWTDAKSWGYESPFALTLTYHMSISADDLVDKSIEEMEHIHPLNDEEKKNYHSELESAFINVKDGDRITAMYSPKKGVVFYCNGVATKSVESLSFAHSFLDIWLSDKTSEPEMRKQLLRTGA